MHSPAVAIAHEHLWKCWFASADDLHMSNDTKLRLTLFMGLSTLLFLSFLVGLLLGINFTPFLCVVEFSHRLSRTFGILLRSQFP